MIKISELVKNFLNPLQKQKTNSFDSLEVDEKIDTPNSIIGRALKNPNRDRPKFLKPRAETKGP